MGDPEKFVMWMKRVQSTPEGYSPEDVRFLAEEAEGAVEGLRGLLTATLEENARLQRAMSEWKADDAE